MIASNFFEYFSVSSSDVIVSWVDDAPPCDMSCRCLSGRVSVVSKPNKSNIECMGEIKDKSMDSETGLWGSRPSGMLLSS